MGVRTILVMLACGAGLALATARAATPAVSLGEHHAVALARDGTVRAWGDDRVGELGVGRRLASPNAIAVTAVRGASDLAAADGFSLAVQSDGTAWGWGYDGADQLGDGTETDRPSPASIDGVAGLSAIAGRNYHAAALGAGGSVWAWGENGSGQIGIGTNVNQPTPIQVPGLSGFIAIGVGDVHTVALRNDGVVFAWGDNTHGELGDGTTVNRSRPQPVPALGGVTMISAGGAFTLALTADGSVWSWGGNESGQLGDGTFTDRSIPARVTGLPARAIAISAGGAHALALLADGTVWAWGYNGNLLGDGSSYTRAVPGPVSNLAHVIAISAGSTFSLALESDGSVWSWGYNGVGQLGDGTFVDHSTPVRVAGLSGADRISAGYAHALARTSDGTVWTWGDDSVGELGDASVIERATPARVAGLSGVVAIASGDFHVLALKGDGTVWAWGMNDQSELGDGTTTNRSTPAPVAGVSGIVAIAAGGGHSIALKGDGTLVTWGYNYSGQLGYGNDQYTNGLPAPVAGFGGVKAIAAGYLHSVAVRDDGTAWAWGSNASGQLGDGTTTDRFSPTQVPGLANVRSISAGNAFTLALRADGTVWAWGSNAFGQLGDGTRTDRSSPVQVQGLSDVVAISAGGAHSLALERDGSVWAWGSNEVGLLGDGTTQDRLVPVRVAGIIRATSISAGRAVYYGLSLAAMGDGTVWAWGDYRNGQLGDGSVAQRELAVIVRSEGGSGSLATNDWFLDLDPASAKQIPPDKIPALLVLAAGNTKAARVAVQANVRFRSQDVGNPIFVFGYVPAALAKRDAAEKDGSPCVLAQLSASGTPQQVAAANLQGYASNVVSTQGQAVTVLNGAASSAIAGSTFCLGTAASAGDAVNAANSSCVATVPPVSSGDTVCLPPAPAVAPQVPGALSGLWWNSGESGWGVDFTQRRDVVFAAWYTYDASGNPKWYVASDCRLPAAGVTSGTCNGTLYEVSGPTFFAAPFDPSAVHVSSAGSLAVSFADADNATMTYSVGSLSRTIAITRQPIASGAAPAVDYTDLWWNPNESGWGLSVAEQANVMFLAWFVYDDTGKPTWYVASDCVVSGNGCSGTLYRTTGPPLGPAFDASRVQVSAAGTVNLTFTDPNNGTLRYTADGVTASKAITRQLF